MNFGFLSQLKRNELALRTLSSIALISGILYFMSLSLQSFLLLVAVYSSVMLFEWRRMVSYSKCSLFSNILSIMLAWIALAFLYFAGKTHTLWVASAFISLCIISFIEGIYYDYRKSIRFKVISYTGIWLALGILYCIFPAAFIFVLLTIGHDNYHLIIFIILLLSITCGTDIGAYIFGKTLGGPKLNPAISPNKRWSGVLGGVLTAVLVSKLWCWWFEIVPDALSTIIMLCAAIASIVSQIGDLVESRIKRHFGIKDTGSIIPGHGGAIDRADGLVAVIWILVMVFVPIALIKY